MKLTNTSAIALCLPLFASSLLACANLEGTEGYESEDVVAATEQPLYTDSAHLWPQDKAIPVCWDNNRTGLDAEKKRDVRAVVENAWTRKVGIHFSGWGTCSSATAPGIHLRWQFFINHDGRSVTEGGLGRHADGRASIMFDEDANEYVFAHEFGHALGFAHEQNRPDFADAALACQPTNACGNNSDCLSGRCVSGTCAACGDDMATCVGGYCRQGSNGDTLATPYDGQSLMNYLGPNDGILTPLDVAGARASYPGLRPVKLLQRNGKCVGVSGNDRHGAGTGTDLWDCRPDVANNDRRMDEEWSLRPTTDGYFRIVNMVSGLCLGVAGVDSYASMATTEVYHCDPAAGDARRDEEWRTVDLGDGYVALQNRVGGMYLRSWGSQVRMSSALYYDASGFKLVDLPVSHRKVTMKLRNAASDLCVDTPGVDIKSGPAYMDMYHCASNTNDPGQDEEFEIVPTDSGYFKLKNANSGLCLGVVGVDLVQRGAAVESYYCDATATDAKLDSQWKLMSGTTSGVNTVRLQNRKSNYCLGVRGFDSHGPGTGLEVYDCAPTTNDPKKDENWILY